MTNLSDWDEGAPVIAGRVRLPVFGDRIQFVLVDHPEERGFEIHVRVKAGPKLKELGAIRKQRRELAMKASSGSAEPQSDETSEDSSAKQRGRAAEDLADGLLAADIAVRGTRRLRRAFYKRIGASLQLAEKVGPAASVGFLLIANLAWVFALCYASFQFASFVLALNPGLFWLLIVGFVLQRGTAGYLKTQLRHFLGEERLASWAAA